MHLKQIKKLSSFNTKSKNERPRKEKKSAIARICHLKSRCRGTTKQHDDQNPLSSHDEDNTSILQNSDAQGECGVDSKTDFEYASPVENITPKGNVEEASYFSAQSEMAILHNSLSESKSFETPKSSTTLQSVITSRSQIFCGFFLDDTPISQSSRRSKLSERKWFSLHDDPTIEESVECVFSHQLEDTDVYVNDCSSHENYQDSMNEFVLDDPSGYCDSLNYLTPDSEDENRGEKSWPDRMFHDGRYIPSSENAKGVLEKGHACITEKLSMANHARCQSCTDGKSEVPSLVPSKWPQLPLLLRPTPGSGTRVKGIRFANNSNYLNITDLDRANFTIDSAGKQIVQPTEFCPGCCDIPINNGSEAEGRSLVADFESPYFMGTMHIRIRGSYKTMEQNNYRNGYFKGVNRHYQVIIRGCFKKDGIPMTECVTGQVFNGPLKSPGSYISKGAVKVMNFFAPRLQAKLNGDMPFILSPLGSTPATVSIDPRGDNEGDYKADVTISERHEEPFVASRTLIPVSKNTASSSSATRAKNRKKAFDKLCASNNKSITFQTDKVYTFEFLQHLIDFENFELGLGSLLGKFKLDTLLNGKCINIMAAHQRHPIEGEIVNQSLDTLWSFDLWHETLLEAARHL